MGRVPVFPSEFAWDTLVSHVHGPMAREVKDIGLLMSVLAGPDDRDPISLPAQIHDYAAAGRYTGSLSGRRAAFTANLAGTFPVDDEVRSITRAAAMKFLELDCAVSDASFDASDLREIIAGTRGFGMVARYAHRPPAEQAAMSVALQGQIADALRLDVRAVAKSERLRSSYYQRVRSFLERYDYILLPTVGAPPFRVDEPLPTQINGDPVERYYDVFLAGYAFSITGLPCISIPCGETEKGLPVGLQIVGKRQRDDLVLEAASAFSAAWPALFKKPRVASAQINQSFELVTPGIRS